MSRRKLFLPAAVPLNERAPCRVCGGEPNGPDDLEHVLPDGTVSMSVEPDLCLECATHLWRAFKFSFPPDGVDNIIQTLLRAYPETAPAMLQAKQKEPIQ